MGKIVVYIHADQNDEIDVNKMIELLRNPRWNYSSLRQLLSFFTTEDIVWIEHVFQCFDDKKDPETKMMMVWAICSDQSERLYLITFMENMTH